jgi:EmrB/QacA subfamily drug resistance transporter
MNADRSRWLALYVLCVGMLMIVLDATVVNVALPSIQEDLGFSSASLAWVVNAYLITFGGLLLLAGRLGDLIGRRTVFLSGLGVFTAASLACGFAQSQGVLVAARFVQGVGGSLTSAVILGMIVTMFTEPREQAKAVGVFAFVASAGGAVGLLAGGVLTQLLNWHWIFFINLPIGVLTAVFARRLVARDRGTGLRDGVDVPGAVLITAALMLAVFAIVKPAAEDGWTSGRTLAFGGIAFVLLAGFLVREATARTPLMPLRIFRSRNLVGANLIQVVGAAGMFGTFFLGALYLQRVEHYDALKVGFAFLPVTMLMGTLSVRYSERLITRFSARSVCIPGLVLIMAGLTLFTRAPVDGNYWVNVFPVMVVLGIGAGLCFPAMMGLGMSGAAPSDAGLASGLINTTGQVGGALGLAVLATTSASRTQHLVTSGASMPSALTAGYHFAFWIAAGLVIGAIMVGALILQTSRASQGESTTLTVAEVGQIAQRWSSRWHNGDHRSDGQLACGRRGGAEYREGHDESRRLSDRRDQERNRRRRTCQQHRSPVTSGTQKTHPISGRDL